MTWIVARHKKLEGRAHHFADLRHSFDLLLQFYPTFLSQNKGFSHAKAHNIVAGFNSPRKTATDERVPTFHSQKTMTSLSGQKQCSHFSEASVSDFTDLGQT